MFIGGVAQQTSEQAGKNTAGATVHGSFGKVLKTASFSPSDTQENMPAEWVLVV